MVQSARYDGSTVIRSYLYLGSVNDARDSAQLRMLGITHLISAAAEFPPSVGLGVEALHIPLFDRTNERISSRFGDAEVWISEAKKVGGRVLVYCQHGVSRSATLCIAHLMREDKLTLRDALLEVRRLRPEIEPNPSFLCELRTLEFDLFGRFVTLERLTLMDPGLIKYETIESRAERAVQECLALALVSTERASTLPTMRESEAAKLVEEALLANDLTFVDSTVIDAFESFAGSTVRDEAARMSLARIIRSLTSTSRHDAIAEKLQGLRLTDRWTELVLDVPLAPKYLDNLLDFLRVHHST